MHNSRTSEWSWRLILASLLLVAACSPSEVAEEEGPEAAEAEFAYSGDKGPGFWGSLNPQWRDCSSNNRQTPIDIADISTDPDLAAPQLDLQPAPIRLVNRGFDIQQNYTEGEGGSIRLGETVYRLVQFHFHTLSEHTVNGSHAPMELHVVFVNPDAGDLAVIGVFYQIGQENAFLAQFSGRLPVKKGDRFDSPNEINVAEELTSISSFYTYLGSLTTPGCAPIVTWIVLKQPASMSEGQFQSFRGIMGNNFRPLQKRGDRIIRATPGEGGGRQGRQEGFRESNLSTDN